MKKHFFLALMALLMPLVLWAQTDKLEVTVTSSEIGYNGSDTKNAVNISVMLNGEALELGTNYSLKYLFGDDSDELTLDQVRNVGTYKVIVKGMGDNAAAIDAAYNATYSAAKPSFTVTQKAVTSEQINVDLSQLKLVYGYTNEDIQKGLESVVSVNEGVLAKGDQLTEFIKCLKLNVVNGLEVGKSNEVSVVSKEDASTNYKFVSSGNTSGFINISPATLNISLKNRAYTGTTITAANWVSMAKSSSSVIIEGYKDSESTVADQSGALGLTLSAVEGNDYINVGDYKVNVAIDNINYQLESLQVDLKITPAKITIVQGDDIADTKFAKSYDTAKVYDLTNLFKISGMKSYDSDKVGYVDNDTEGYQKISMKLEQETAHAGEYNIVPYVNDELVSEEEYATIIPNYIIDYPAKNKKTYTINTYALSSARVKVYVDESKTAYQGKDFVLQDGTFIVVYFPSISTSKIPENYAEFQTAIETEDADGKPKEPALAEGKDFVYLTVGEDGDYTVARSTSIANKNIKNISDGELSYVLTAVTDGNYSRSVTQSFTMSQAQLVITPKNGEDAPTMVYGTKAPATGLFGTATFRDVTKYYDIPFIGEDEEDEEGLGLYMVLNSEFSEDAGKYSVYPVTTDVRTTNNFVKEYKDLLDNYVISFDPADSKNKFVVTPKNLADENIVITTADPVYKGGAYTTLTVAAKYVIGKDEAGKEIVLEPAPKNNTDFTTTINTKEAINAGEEIIATITGKGSYEYDEKNETFGGNYYGTQEKKFTIQKATLVLTVSPNLDFDFNPSVTAEGRLKDYTLIYEGGGSLVEKKLLIQEGTTTATKLQGQDQGKLSEIGLALQLKGKAAEGKVGTWGVDTYKAATPDEDYAYTVTSYGDILNNYNVKVVGQVIINGASDITIGRGINTTEELLKGYDGSDNITVYVKEDRTIAADLWYAMVLPFDIKVRDFSAAIGYAVVDVPDTENNNAGIVSFKLHTGVIPANTLFVFKTDEDRYLGSDGEKNRLSFDLTDLKTSLKYYDEKTYHEEEEVPHYVTDAAGNIYYGVYTSISIKDYSKYQLNSNPARPEQNRFYSTGTAANPRTVNELEGYVLAAAGANARFFVEDIDGTVTEISAVTGEEISNNAEGWYTINGVKLNAEPTEKGIYINNGKKVVIK